MKHAHQIEHIGTLQREVLISMTAVIFIEEYALLSRDKLEDARQSLPALFLRTSGEETFLRKLIEILRSTQQIHRSFAAISSTVTGIGQCARMVDGKITALRRFLEQFKVSAEENTDFVGSFLSFSQNMQRHLDAFHRSVEQYLRAREDEARHGSIYHIARDARTRLRQRFSGGLGAAAHGEVENKIKQEVISSFDYSEAETNYKYAARESQSVGEEVQAQLKEIRAMCQMAMNPTMREDILDRPPGAPQYDDVFKRFAASLRRHPRLLQIKGPVLELFKLYQHAYGMFVLDLSHLNRPIETMMEYSQAYFEAKDEEADIRAKREKLHRIEGLIPFLERAAGTLGDEELNQYARFSRQLSDIISEAKAPWAQIGEGLLRCKVQAEAELSTRLE